MYPKKSRVICPSVASRNAYGWPSVSVRVKSGFGRGLGYSRAADSPPASGVPADGARRPSHAEARRTRGARSAMRFRRKCHPGKSITTTRRTKSPTGDDPGRTPRARWPRRGGCWPARPPTAAGAEVPLASGVQDPRRSGTVHRHPSAHPLARNSWTPSTRSVCVGSPLHPLNARHRSNDSSTGGWYSTVPQGVFTSPPSDRVERIEPAEDHQRGECTH